MARPRKTGARHPCGQLKRSAETAAPVVVRRIIDQAVRGAADPLLGTELGRLRLTDVIDSEQLAAGERFAEIVGAVDRVDGMPRRSPMSPAYERGFGQSAGDGRDDDVRSAVRTRGRYLEALEAMPASGRRIVIEVVVHGRPVPSGAHGDLRTALSLLAVHFGLTRMVSVA